MIISSSGTISISYLYNITITMSVVLSYIVTMIVLEALCAESASRVEELALLSLARISISV